MRVFNLDAHMVGQAQKMMINPEQYLTVLV